LPGTRACSPSIGAVKPLKKKKKALAVDKTVIVVVKLLL
jgi:hypothetical protein